MTAPALPVGGSARATGAPRRSGRALRVAAALLALGATGAAILALTHASATTHPRPAAVARINADTPINGKTLQQARCSDWLAASAAQRAAAVASLTAIVGGPTEYKGVRGTTLSSAQAFQLMDNACSNRIARNFLLYELYVRAAAFSRLAQGGL